MAVDHTLNVRCWNLCQIIPLCKGPCLARTVNKSQRTLITVPNCLPILYRCNMAAVKLVLYTSWVVYLPLFLATLYFIALPLTRNITSSDQSILSHSTV
jgi:hypothetical protein